MTARILDLPAGVTRCGGGFRVRRDDGVERMVFRRVSDDGWAVYNGMSTDKTRLPDHLGYAGSWHQKVEAAIEWARTVTS